jgi:hypothetical protein
MSLKSLNARLVHTFTSLHSLLCGFVPCLCRSEVHSLAQSLPAPTLDDAIVNHLSAVGLPMGLTLSSCRTRDVFLAIVVVPAMIDGKLTQTLQWHVASCADVPIRFTMTVALMDKGACVICMCCELAITQPSCVSSS